MHDPIYDIELYADQAGCPANVMIMGAEVWRTLRSFKNSVSCTIFPVVQNPPPNWPVKTGEVVSFKGYLGDLALIVYSGKYTDSDGTENISLSLICWSG